MASKPPDGVYWLSQDDYDKVISQLRRHAYRIFDFLKVDDKLPVRYVYGTEAFVHGAVQEIVRLAEDFGLKVRGVDKVISIDKVRRNGRGDGR